MKTTYYMNTKYFGEPVNIVQADSLAELRTKHKEYISHYGASELPTAGSLEVYTLHAGRKIVVARFSYNGRLWTPEADWKQRREIKIESNDEVQIH